MEYKLIAPRRDNTTFLEQILFNRGFTSREEIQHFLMSDENDINNPLLLDNIHEGVQLLAKHAKLNSHVLIIVDSDCDGYTSSSILMNYLHRHFPSWIENNWNYFIHSGKQHGLEDVMQEINWKQYQLIVCPDSASNDYTCHQTLKENNIDCLILDHHLADNGYSADAIVINNQLSENYPNKAFCGAGIVWQFCNYIDKVMKTNYAIEYEDLTALGLKYQLA